jgi:hypothetical protein
MRRHFTWKVGAASLVVVSATLTLGGCAAVQGPVAPAGLEPKIEKASSRTDHEAIAQQYEQQAVVDMAAAKRHQGYAAIYRRNKSPSGIETHGFLADHCEGLAKTYEQAADKGLALAKLHRELAAAAR